MTVVNHETGEVAELLDEPAARRLTEQVRLLLISMLDQRDKVLGLIREARERQAYTALGYPSFGAYVTDEFADALPRLDRADRVAVEIELTEMGMSSRAIAPVVGVSDRQVRSDTTGGGKYFPPETKAPEGDEPPAQVDVASTATVVEDAGASRSAAAPDRRPPVTGIDGKVYPIRQRPHLAPVPDRDPELVNAEQWSTRFALWINGLLDLADKPMRGMHLHQWHDGGSEAVSPSQLHWTTPENIRKVARGLLAFADDMEAYDQ